MTKSMRWTAAVLGVLFLAAGVLLMGAVPIVLAVLCFGAAIFWRRPAAQ